MSPEPVRLILARRELRRVLEEGHEAGILHPAQRSLAQGIFAVAGRPVERIPRALEQFPGDRADMNKQDVLAMAERQRAPLVPVEAADSPGSLIGYVRVIDLKLERFAGAQPVAPLLDIRQSSTHLAALMRLESANESLARVVNVRGETLGIVTTERLQEPLLGSRHGAA